MSNLNKIQQQKKKIEQKKAKLTAEENKLKIKERKMRTRHLIEVGGLVVKSGLDSLPSNTLYGALLSLTQSLKKDSKIKDTWTKLGSSKFDVEAKELIPVIIKFTEKEGKEVRDNLRTHNLKWNKFRNEWYGNVTDLDSLKQSLRNIKYQIEIIPHS